MDHSSLTAGDVQASGRVGGAFAEELLKTGKHTITALTRPDSTSSFPSGVKVVKADYSNHDSLVSALRGQDFLIITLAVGAPPNLHSDIVKAAVEAGIPYIMPNSYGYVSSGNKILLERDQYAAATVQKCTEIESLGAAYVDMCCGFWYEWSLSMPEQWYGFTIKDRKVTFFDDGKTKIQTSTWLHCGKALASFLSLPVKAEGQGPAIEQWKNKPLVISSFKVSQRDMLDSLHRVLGTKDSDWEIRYEDSAKRMVDGQEELKKGDIRGFAKGMYSGLFNFTKENGFGDMDVDSTNKVLDLPKEDFDEATKRTVDMVNDGFAEKVFGEIQKRQLNTST